MKLDDVDVDVDVDDAILTPLGVGANSSISSFKTHSH